ncbi:uncharacterized protein LOC136034633 [Artemia franciscana]|uniref:uncharacterized protein LOC136034633 n=1 Tax=Artemia franciscana TaxID=6661 RepID=UPI0032DA5B28
MSVYFLFQRVDGRTSFEFRKISIHFGISFGSCHVSFGHTRVFAQVSWEIVKPRSFRPNEGDLFINVELTPIAAPHYEVGRLGEFGTELNRLVERCLKESKSVDVESLCIIRGEMAFRIRCDVHVLNDDGNLVDACCLAAHSALCHFRRPDFTVAGKDVTIHPIDEGNPVPLCIFHHPLAVTYAFFNNGKQAILDPTYLEQAFCDGQLVVGMNTYKEICTWHLGGRMSISKAKLIRLTDMTYSIVTSLVNLMEKALSKDAEIRASGDVPGLLSIVRPPALKSGSVESDLDMAGLKIQMEGEDKDEEGEVEEIESAAVEEAEDEESESESESSEVEMVTEISAEEKRKLAEVELSGDSEEEETVQLQSEMTSGTATTPGLDLIKNKRKRKPRKRWNRLPKNYDPKYVPDPERWIPKRERAGYKKRKDRKARGGIGKGTQGSAEGSQVL